MYKENKWDTLWGAGILIAIIGAVIFLLIRWGAAVEGECEYSTKGFNIPAKVIFLNSPRSTTIVNEHGVTETYKLLEELTDNTIKVLENKDIKEPFIYVTRTCQMYTRRIESIYIYVKDYKDLKGRSL